MNILFVGLPGVGKSLLSKMVAKKLSLFFVDMGEILRNSNNKEVLNAISEGKLVDSKKVIDILKKYLCDEKDNIIFNGVPRNLEQKNIFPYKIDLVIYLYLPEKILLDRVDGRYVCEKCGKIYMLNEIDEIIDGIHYHFPAILPKESNVCDVCGGKLIKRKDDTIEIMKKRICDFYKETYPMIEEYMKETRFIKFVPNGPPEKVCNELINKIEMIKNEN